MFAIHSLLAIFTLAALFHQRPHLSVTQPYGDTLDQEVKIQIEQLTPLQTIELEAKAIDQEGETWTSHAFFQANDQGIIDVSAQQPLPGSSYETADAMGLFWSMLPPSKNHSSTFKCKDDRCVCEVTMRQNGKLIKKETITRFLKKPNIQKIDIRENGLVGSLFLPPSKKPLPVIITVSGSNGGLSEDRAKLLASNGFAVFALGYFRVEGLPSNLQEIPLEYFESAFAWLKKQRNIDSSRVGLYGVSRGGELALILGSVFPDSVQAITAVVPSSVVYGGFSPTPTNAWIYNKKPVYPFAPAPQNDFERGKGRDSEHPATMRQTFLEGMNQKELYETAAIPVEKIRCPILIISGGDDQLWPSDIFATQILDRLKKNNSSIVCHHLHYPSAGHGITVPNLPISGPTYFHPVVKLWLSLGGSRAHDAQASRDSWKKIVDFFRESLEMS